MLTSPKNNHIASNDHILAVARISVYASLFETRVVPAYRLIGKNCPMPPATIKPPTARFTRRLRKEDQGQRLLRRRDVIAQASARPNHVLERARNLQYVREIHAEMWGDGFRRGVDSRSERE